MDDYSALAQRVAVSVGDVRGCIILSRDGMVLGVYPEDDEAQSKPAWLQFMALGTPEKSFVEFADQIWTFVHRGAYSAFAVAGTSVRPGVLLDMMEQALMTAEEARTKREPLKLPEVGVAPSGKPRSALHPEAKPAVPETVDARSRAAAADQAKKGSKGPEATAPDVPEPHHAPEPKLMSASEPAEEEAEEEVGEVDRVMLAQEFSRLLQEDGSDDE